MQGIQTTTWNGAQTDIANNKRRVAQTMDTGITIKNLSVQYGGKTALRSISTELRGGCITGIIGPNGAGKSTMLKGLMRLVPTVSGEVYVNGEEMEKMRRHIAYVEQRSEIDLTFPISVFDTVLLGTYPKLGLFRRAGKLQKQKAWDALETVKMSEFANRQIGALSGGQLQRVFIARALAQETEVFLLDEPFVGIDMVSEELIMNILFQLRDDGKTIAIVHHDLNKVSTYFDDVIILNRSLISSGPVQESFTAENIAKAYGQAWVVAVPGEVAPA